MVIASKMCPHRTDRTYFNSGRAAFTYLIDSIVRPRRVFLPAFTCWSLVSTMQRRFPQLETRFYPVRRDLSCQLPPALNEDDALVLIHFFGYENLTALPQGQGTILEDRSHAFLSQMPRRGHHIFGSLRKMARIGDGGFLEGRYNPIYEPSRKLDTWLRYESVDWRDMREAENMMDRDWQMTDMSSQSLAVILALDPIQVRMQRRANEAFLAQHLTVGRPMRPYASGECPLLHQRLFETTEERDSLRSYLAQHQVFCSIHWPTHPSVRISDCDSTDAEWLEHHSLAIPVGSDYGESDMEHIVRTAQAWQRAGG